MARPARVAGIGRHAAREVRRHDERARARRAPGCRPPQQPVRERMVGERAVRVDAFVDDLGDRVDLDDVDPLERRRRRRPPAPPAPARPSPAGRSAVGLPPPRRSRGAARARPRWLPAGTPSIDGRPYGDAPARAPATGVRRSRPSTGSGARPAVRDVATGLRPCGQLAPGRHGDPDQVGAGVDQARSPRPRRGSTSASAERHPEPRLRRFAEQVQQLAARRRDSRRSGPSPTARGAWPRLLRLLAGARGRGAGPPPAPGPRRRTRRRARGPAARGRTRAAPSANGSRTPEARRPVLDPMYRSTTSAASGRPCAIEAGDAAQPQDRPFLAERRRGRGPPGPRAGERVGQREQAVGVAPVVPLASSRCPGRHRGGRGGDGSARRCGRVRRSRRGRRRTARPSRSARGAFVSSMRVLRGEERGVAMGRDATTATLTSPSGTSPIRWTIASRWTSKRSAISSAIRWSIRSAIDSCASYSSDSHVAAGVACAPRPPGRGPAYRRDPRPAEERRRRRRRTGVASRFVSSTRISGPNGASRSLDACADGRVDVGSAPPLTGGMQASSSPSGRLVVGSA